MSSMSFDKLMIQFIIILPKKKRKYLADNSFFLLIMNMSYITL